MVTGLHSQEGRITQTRDHLPADNTELTSTALPGTAVYSDDLSVCLRICQCQAEEQGQTVRLSDCQTESLNLREEQQVLPAVSSHPCWR